MKNVLNVVALVAMGALSACGGENKGADAGGNLTDGRPVNCEQAWTQTVAAHPQGRVEEFQTETRTVAGGSVISTSTERDTTRVLESNNDRVSVETSVPQRRPSTTTMTRADFMKFCGQGMAQGMPRGLPVDAGAEVLERSRKSVTVPAGTFDCAYKKTRSVRLDAAVVTNEEWVDGQGTTVKSISTTDMQAEAGGASTQTILTRELVRRG